ncbi:type I-D CRISPR-associated protein Cas5/Csc1 [Leptolyngbya ohadii]|uniref:type I-D CRISPR-associated protein Cas5/Csc1 n=1 Tax=Leptolyngbya ohadii TaxID=1962290 RepID=UPI000B59A247|nr:type I-D CRISPR-associated protein Cas5/Csc1 [Leptolyngbya ohadii]
MVLYYCTLTLHDNVFFATREMGILYETEKYLHNWAISFALFETEYIPRPYRLGGEMAQKPSYLDRHQEQNLLCLNDVGIYVFPAQPIVWAYQINTFKAAQVSYYGISKQFGEKDARRNYPVNYGRAKELAVGSQYRTFIVAPDSVELPSQKWIRLGKWAAKLQVQIQPIPESGIAQKSGEFLCQHPLNPLDLPNSTQLVLYNRIVMPPVSLVSQAKLNGDYWLVAKPSSEQHSPQWSNLTELPNPICLPRGAFYGARQSVVAS